MRFWILAGLLLLTSQVVGEDFNHYQMIGSHNSYKRALPPTLLRFIQAQSPQMAVQLDYSHLSLTSQLDAGLRHLEIDVVNDPEGKQYSYPEMEARLNESWLTKQERKMLQEPGFKVIHIPHVDVLSHCIAFTACLKHLVTWSDNHPAHFPVVILLNAKENQPEFIESAPPAPFTDETYTQLDAQIRQAMQHKLITPDSIRGNYLSLREAVLQRGWPDIDSLRGKFLFLFDGNESQRTLYAKDHGSLTGRSMFASYPATHDAAAFMVLNDPIAQQEEIKALVRQGFVVRTRADADFSATSQVMAAQQEAAFRSGAQIISTDFYPHSPQSVKSGYSVRFANQKYRRKNPLMQHINSTSIKE